MTTHEFVPGWRPPNEGSHITRHLVESKLNDSGQFYGTLAELESAWNPASTKHPIWGPAKVTYVQHIEGGWSVHVE